MAIIPTQTIEQIAAANDIVEVIGTYFPLKRAGASFKALCPFHQEKTPSFTVSPPRQTFHCFGCGVGGSVFRFVMEYEHVDFPTAVRKLGARVNIPVVEERGASESEDRQYEARRTLLRLHAEAAEWFHDNLLKKKFAASAREYLKQRGIPIEIAKRWQLGYAPDEWNAFGNWARTQGYETRILLASGLVKTKDEADAATSHQTSKIEHQTSYDRFRGRLMFPICNDVGEVIAFSGRILQNDEEGAKYLNSPETPLFRKGKVLFGLHKTKRPLIEANCAIVCEGQIDLITLFEAGITNVVAPQGTAFTENQARVLKRYVNEVVLCFDADAAGQKAAERSLDALLQNDLIVRFAEMPAGEDPDSLIRHKGKEEFNKRIAEARDFFDYWIEHETATVDLSSLGAKMDLARRLAETVSKVHDTLMRGEVSNKVCARVGIPTAEFQSLLPKASRARFSDGESRRAEPVPAPRHDIAMLCLLALRDEGAREFLCQQNWREVLDQTSGGELLARILESEIRTDDAASLNAFMATLSPGEEGIIASWLMQKMPPNARVVAEQWWMGLRQNVLRRQLQVAEGRMKLPGLNTGEVVNLQKQILDLQKECNDLPRLSSAPKIDPP
jgi:DNA primase